MAGSFRFVWLAVFLAVSCLCVNGTMLAENPVPPATNLTIDGKCLRVIDGDTVEVETRFTYRVRLIDCWAPESRTSDLAEKQRGLRSKSKMVQLAEGKAVRVSIPLGRSFTDITTMGRVLGRVWVTDDGQLAVDDLSTIMVREGMATKAKAVQE